MHKLNNCIVCFRKNCGLPTLGNKNPLKQEKPLHEGKNISLGHFSVISKENTAKKEKSQFPKISAGNNFGQS